MAGWSGLDTLFYGTMPAEEFDRRHAEQHEQWLRSREKMALTIRFGSLELDLSKMNRRDALALMSAKLRLETAASPAYVKEFMEVIERIVEELKE